MGHKRITIKDVAREAGVSTQTVSRVANQRADVAPATREHVQAVIKRLGYQPSSLARSLIQGQSYTLGVVTYGLRLYGPSALLEGIQQVAVQAGYSLMLKTTFEAATYDAAQILQRILAYHVDGILWAVPEIGQNREGVQSLQQKIKTPLLFLNAQPRPNLATLAIDNKLGGKLATQHLIENGCRRIGIITGPMDWWEARQRELGWRRALTEAGLPVDESRIAHGDWTPRSGEQAIQSLLEWHPELDGVFVSNDQMALGAMKVAQKMGRRIPEDLAVVGFDDIPESPYFTPSLSTIRQPLEELGGLAVRQLIELIGEKPESRPLAMLLPPELVVRRSSGG